MFQGILSAITVCSRASIILLFLLTFDLARGQPQPAQGSFIMLIFIAGESAEAWTMNADPTGGVAVCRQTSNPQGKKQNGCRHGTQSQTSYAELQSLASDARTVPGTKAPPAPNHSEFQVIISQYGGMRYDPSQVATNPVLKQLADLMVQTNRRIGGEDFVPRF